MSGIFNADANSLAYAAKAGGNYWQASNYGDSALN
jgi:hypothetical protein